jgi:hypothetical protein
VTIDKVEECGTVGDGLGLVTLGEASELEASRRIGATESPQGENPHGKAWWHGAKVRVRQSSRSEHVT